MTEALITQDLKPCPFCGCAAEPDPENDEWIVCSSPSCWNEGPGAWFWAKGRTRLEHELSDDIRPATALEKALLVRNSNSFGPDTPSPSPVGEKGESFQDRVANWMLACFNPTIAADVVERNDRFIEEALELTQANGYTAERAHALVDYVFGRPVGEPDQEVGGVMVTLAALCNVAGLSIEGAAAREIARIEAPEIMEKIRRKQAAKPTGSALPVPPVQGENGKLLEERPMTRSPGTSRQDRREAIIDAIRRETQDEKADTVSLVRFGKGDILELGCKAFGYNDPADAAAKFRELIADAILALDEREGLSAAVELLSGVLRMYGPPGIDAIVKVPADDLRLILSALQSRGSAEAQGEVGS